KRRGSPTSKPRSRPRSPTRPGRSAKAGSRPGAEAEPHSTIYEFGQELVSALAPLLDADGIADVILVHTLDLQEPHRRSLVAQTELFGDPPARTVARDDRRLEPVQLQHVERVLHD